MPCHQPGRRFGIVAHAANMAERNVQLALEGPQLVQTFYLKVKVIVGNGNFDHASASVLEPLEIEADDGMIHDDSGQFPPILAQRIQLLLAGRFLLRQIAGEQLVLPHGLIADVDHGRDRRGGRAGIDSVPHDLFGSGAIRGWYKQWVDDLGLVSGYEASSAAQTAGAVAELMGSFPI
jgi:hypothetical protein